MGEEMKQEPAKEEVKTEEKKEEQTEEKVEEEEKKEDPKPPSPFVLYVDLHCVGCAKKIERSISKIRGVEGVVIDMAQNQVTIKGVIEPQAVCDRITKKTKRVAKVFCGEGKATLSESEPWLGLPAAEGEPIPEVVASQVSGLTTVELNVNMHCEACAEQLKKKILRMRGVRSAETEASTGKVTVTGTMDANKLVDYVYRRTKKQAKIVSQPEPEPEKPVEETKPDEAKPVDEPKPEDKKDDNGAAPEKKDGGDGEIPPEEDKKEDGGGEGGGEEMIVPIGDHGDEHTINKMMYYYPYQPLYVIERIPPPQLFSDENPNACCIT